MTEKPTALITGASRGFGAALAEALAPTHHIIAVARTTGALEELDDRIQARGGSTTLAPMDVTEAAAMQHLCRGIHDRWGKLELWVHTAIHVSALTPADHLTEKDWDKQVEINIRATGRLIPYVSPLLQAAENGTAVFVDDADTGGKFKAPYAASKAAQRALFAAWAAESEKTGHPRIVSFTPEPMPTATRARFYPGEDRETLTHPSVEAARLLTQL